MLLETISTNQAQIQADSQASQQATQNHFDQFDDRMNATSAVLADLATRQASTQKLLDNLAASDADMRTRQAITQNQLDSLLAYSIEYGRAIAALGFRSVNHEGRLDDLEGGSEAE